MATPSQFGSFFRQCREKLGLSLNEFCRRNGFDKGNVSRLENGKLRPPKSEKAMRSYAKALELEPGTRDYEHIYALAAAENGVLPPAMTTSRAVREQLPAVFRQVSGRGRRESWTKARDLEAWANTTESKTQLPRLVRRLIHATAPTLQQIYMPTDEGIERKGWDGIVETTEGSAFVPMGLSVWELSTSADFARKANDDFANRCKNSLGLNPAETALVVVTLRKWEGHDEWARKKCERGIWRDVRVIDSAILQDWLEHAPAVDAWLAELLGKRPSGVVPLEAHWQSLQSLSDPPLTATIFLASRGETQQQVKDWLLGPVSALTLQTNSPSDAIDFVTALVVQETAFDADSAEIKTLLSETERCDILSRAVIVSAMSDWRSLAAVPGRLILLPRPGLPLDETMIAEAVRNGHHVLAASGQNAHPQSRSVPLPRPLRHDLFKALVASEWRHEDADRLVSECGGSLGVLKRRVSLVPSLSLPSWSLPEHAAALAPLLLLGAWDEDQSGDREVVEKVTGRGFREVAALANRWLGEPDPPLTQNASRWRLVSRDESWDLLARHLSRQQLSDFAEAAFEVLAEDDPALELPEDERWLANLKQMVPRHSAILRQGMAESLALLGTKGVEGKKPESAAFAIDVVRRLLENAGWKRWSSLQQLLPLLAEAAPNAFLAALEADLDPRRPESAVLQLFREGSDPFRSRCYHAGLLFALETLAWSREFLSPVAMLLVELEARTKRGNRGNSPLSSLLTIFLPWYPQTTAGVQDRIRVLQRITQRQPDVGCRAAIQLLGEIRHSSSNQKPRWRTWALDWTEGTTDKDYFEQVSACAILAVENVNGIPNWTELLDHLSNFTEHAFQLMVEKLRAYAAELADDDTRRQLASAVRSAIQRHREHSDTDWAIPKEWTDQLEAALRLIEPSRPAARHAWLFRDWVELEDFRDIPYEVRNKILAEKRRDALLEVWRVEGLNGVLDLAGIAEAPGWVGVTLARAGLVNDNVILPALLTSTETRRQTLAEFFASERYFALGDAAWPWLEELRLESWEPEQAARLVAATVSIGSRAWKLVEQLGPAVKPLYWRFARAAWRRDLSDMEHVQAIQGLCEFDRAPEAVREISWQRIELPTELKFHALEALLRWHRDHGDRSLPIQAVHEVFKRLQSELDSLTQEETKRLAELEWAYLTVLNGFGALPETLLRHISTDPEFFAKIISTIWPPKHGETAEPASEEQSRLASHAYRLLMKWKRVPGIRPDGSVDEQLLQDWVKTARRLCRDADRLEVADVTIGEALAHAPAESDESWPCVVVRDVIEEIASADLETGFHVGIRNRRGIHGWSPTVGGKPERSLAQKHADYARACDLDWPRTAAVLRSVAASYERDALREDSRVQEFS